MRTPLHTKIGYTPKRPAFKNKKNFIFLNKEKQTNKKLFEIYLTNIAPSGLKYPN